MATTRKWSAKVDTESTYPEQGLFKKSASTIAKSLASKEVSPKGPASGMRMLNFYINRAGKNLPEERKHELKKAKSLLSDIIAKQKRDKPTAAEKSVAKKAPKKTAKKAAKEVPGKTTAK